MPIDVVILIFFAFWCLIAIVGFLAWLYNRFQWERVRRYRYLTRYHYDDLGNPEYFYDPATEQQFLPTPGNKAFAESLLADKPISEKRNRLQPEIYVQGLPLESDAPLPSTSKALTSGWKSLSKAEVIDLLQEGIDQGMNKTQTLQTYFGVKGGPDFTSLGKSFDRLSGKE